MNIEDHQKILSECHARHIAEIYKNSLECWRAGFENGAASRDEKIAELRQQLAAALAACKLKDEALKEIRDDFDHDNDSHKYGTTCRCCLAEKALAIQPDDSALRSWLGEPFCYLRQTSSEQNPPHGWAVHFSDGEVPLYAPKGMR